MQSVSFVCVCLSLATTPMSPACSRVHLDALLAQRDREVASFSALLARGVHDLLAVHDRAAEHPEERELADVRLGRGLEDERRERAVVVGRGARSPDRGRGALGLLGRRLAGLRHELDDLVEQRAHAVASACRSRRRAGRPRPRSIACLHRVERLLARDVAALEVALEQRLVGGGERLLELGARSSSNSSLQLGRDVGLVVLAGRRALLEDVRLAR